MWRFLIWAAVSILASLVIGIPLGAITLKLLRTGPKLKASCLHYLPRLMRGTLLGAVIGAGFFVLIRYGNPPNQFGPEPPVLPDLLINMEIFAIIGFWAECLIAAARSVLGGRHGEATSDMSKGASGCLGAFLGCVAGALLGGAPAFLGGLLFETWCSHNMNPDAGMGIRLLTGGILLIALYGGALCGIIVGLVWGLRRVKRA
jgi:hypothetical protein